MTILNLAAAPATFTIVTVEKILFSVAVRPALDRDKVGHVAGDLALEEGRVPDDHVRVVGLGRKGLRNGCSEGGGERK
jgi:hypothetical protein